MPFSSFTSLLSANNIVTALILAAVIWVAPHIAFDHYQPFANGYIQVIIAAIALAIQYRQPLIEFIKANRGQFAQATTEKIALCGTKTANWTRSIRSAAQSRWEQWQYRINDASDYRKLRKMPWFMVTGAPQSGAKSLLNGADLHFVEPEQISRDANKVQSTFPAYQWRFTQDAVFVINKIRNQEDDAIIQKRFLRYLRRYRKHRPLNGLIITFSLSDLLLMSSEERSHFINHTQIRLRDLHATLGTQLPVYFVFTKCDLVDGFVDMFNDLSQEELGQIWGMTFSINDCGNREYILNQFTLEFNALLCRLQQRIFTALDSEKKPSTSRQFKLFHPTNDVI